MLTPFIKRFHVGRTKPTQGPGSIPWASRLHPLPGQREQPPPESGSEGGGDGPDPAPAAQRACQLVPRLLHPSLPLPPACSSWLWGGREPGWGLRSPFPHGTQLWMCLPGNFSLPPAMSRNPRKEVTFCAPGHLPKPCSQLSVHIPAPPHRLQAACFHKHHFESYQVPSRPVFKGAN